MRVRFNLILFRLKKKSGAKDNKKYVQTPGEIKMTTNWFALFIKDWKKGR